jgi:DNA-directed RNA polymerase subunit M/transcription elongation factor TFIIS
MRNVKTARGKVLNISALAAQNETARAVGNVPVNARGDIIDNRGKVQVSREEVTKQAYREAAPDATTKIMAIKEDEQNIAEIMEEPKKKSQPKEGKVEEVERQLKQREDGSQYIEIEYSDGSFKTVEVEE